MPVVTRVPEEFVVGVTFQELVQILKDAEGVELPEHFKIEVRQCNPPKSKSTNKADVGFGPKMVFGPESFMQIRVINMKRDDMAKRLLKASANAGQLTVKPGTKEGEILVSGPEDGNTDSGSA